MALQAGASGVPFAAVPGLIGSDLMAVRDDFRIIDDPFAPERRVAIAPAIAPAFALVHALRADPDGNLIIPASGDDALLIQASRTVIATAEEVAPDATRTLTADERLVPGVYVDALAPAPQGAHPLACQSHYPTDAAHIRRYLDAAHDPQSFHAYLDAYVYGPADHAAYLERVLPEAAVV